MKENSTSLRKRYRYIWRRKLNYAIGSLITLRDIWSGRWARHARNNSCPIGDNDRTDVRSRTSLADIHDVKALGGCSRVTDYLRKIILQGRSSKSTKVGDIMTEEEIRVADFFFAFATQVSLTTFETESCIPGLMRGSRG